MKFMKAVIVSAARTPVGAFLGTLSNISAAELGALVIKEVIQRANLKPEQVDEVIMGNILNAGQGQNLARQAQLKAGIPDSATAMTINQVCGSGLRAVALAANEVLSGSADIVVAGGSENMSQGPYVLPGSRTGYRMGNAKVVDSMITDGLWCAMNDIHMGVTAENVAAKWGITREEQDEFAAKSQNKAEQAIATGRFKEEIVPVVIPQKKGDPIVFDTDEFPRSGVTAESLAKLKPAFVKDGTVTAGNASGINDGAAFVCIMTEEKAKELGLKPIATIEGSATAGVDPAIMGVGPVASTKKLLGKLNMTADQLDLVEANEAFAAQSLAVCRDLGFDKDKVNVNGGAISIGHPIGASGCRILVTLLYEMQKRDVKTGLATLCVGGGMGVSVIVSR